MDLNFTFVVFTLSFLIFLGIMKLAFFDKIKEVISARDKFIETNLLAANAALEKSKQELKESNAVEMLNKARLQAQEVISRTIEEASNEKYSIVQHTQLNIQSKINDELELMIREREQLISSLDEKVQEIVIFTLDKFYSEIEGKKAATV